MIYTARVLANNDLVYAMERLSLSSEGTHPQLIRMLSWYVGILVNFSESVGKCGRYLQNFLPLDMWESLMKTYTTAGDAKSIWNVVLETCDLFAKASTEVAKSLDFNYPPELFNYCVTYVHQLMGK